MITWIRVALAVLLLSSMASADCIIKQTEKIGIPLLPDFKGNVTTYCSDNNIIMVDYEADNNFLVGMFASQLPTIPDYLYNLPKRQKWSLYESEEEFTHSRLRPYAPFSSKTIRECDSLRKAEGIDFVWETSAIGRTKDTIADIPCDRVFFSGIGISQGNSKAKCNIKVDIRTAERCVENEPINRTYSRFVDSLGFDPLQHYIVGLAMGVAFNAPVESVEEALREMSGFPIQITLSMEISDWSIFSGEFTYHLDLREIVEKPVPAKMLSVPDSYRPRDYSKTVARKR
ncbi:MAG: hypothetical protein R3F48_00990 [Candidatus Zixiibacteriota bacterium]